MGVICCVRVTCVVGDICKVGVIPVDREEGGKNALKGAIEILEEGGAIGIFPEGTRSRDGKMGKGKTGVARLAATTGAAVVPVAIRQTDDVWPVSKRVPRPWRKFYYKFGDPIILWVFIRIKFLIIFIIF